LVERLASRAEEQPASSPSSNNSAQKESVAHPHLLSHCLASTESLPESVILSPKITLSPETVHVVLSYQTAQIGLLKRVVAALDEAGIASLDGTHVPPGTDWRRFFFPALSKATVFVPILSREFFFSKGCEDETTYAWDKRKVFVPILHDYEALAQVLRCPEAFVDRNDAICEVVPKLESFFNQCNRIPGIGRLHAILTPF